MNFEKLFPLPEPPVDEWVRERLRDSKQITWQEWQTFRMNSWEQELLYPHLDNDALIRLARYFVDQCGRVRRPAITYNDGLIAVIVPILLERLEK